MDISVNSINTNENEWKKKVESELIKLNSDLIDHETKIKNIKEKINLLQTLLLCNNENITDQIKHKITLIRLKKQYGIDFNENDKIEFKESSNNFEPSKIPKTCMITKIKTENENENVKTKNIDKKKTDKSLGKTLINTDNQHEYSNKESNGSFVPNPFYQNTLYNIQQQSNILSPKMQQNMNPIINNNKSMNDENDEYKNIQLSGALNSFMQYNKIQRHYSEFNQAKEQYLNFFSLKNKIDNEKHDENLINKIKDEAIYNTQDPKHSWETKHNKESKITNII